MYNHVFGSDIFFIIYIFCFYLLKKKSLYTSKAEIRNPPGTSVELKQHMYLITERLLALSF